MSKLTTADIAQRFAAALKAGRFEDAEALWSDDVASIEAMDGPMKEVRGRSSVKAKGAWWSENHDVHGFEASGPYLNGDQFAMRFHVDVTPKATGQRIVMDEVGLYTVRDGQVVEERFFY